MSHWSDQYVGQTWTHEQDCYYWFRRISREQFGRNVPAIGDDFVPVDVPTEGDAVFIGPRHIGIMVSIGGKSMVLHAISGLGVMLSDLAKLTIKGFWRYAPNTQLQSA